MVDELLRKKYDNITFYCHNLAGYDIVFILKVLFIYNDNNKDKYNISCVLRDDKIIKVKISKGKNTFSIQDSYCMLNNSLKHLGINFDVSILKTKFPYKFAIQDNLFYKGNITRLNYYEDISKEEYNDIYSEN
jgi:hypothetical protein